MRTTFGICEKISHSISKTMLDFEPYELTDRIFSSVAGFVRHLYRFSADGKDFQLWQRDIHLDKKMMNYVMLAAMKFVTAVLGWARVLQAALYCHNLIVDIKAIDRNSA